MKNVHQTKEGQQLLKEWQERLGLQDWRLLLVENVHPDNMDEQGCSGCISYTESTKCGRIQLLDPKYYEGRMVPYDREQTLVHELLHAKLALLDDTGTVTDRILHQAIDDLARALVGAKRAGQKNSRQPQKKA